MLASKYTVVLEKLVDVGFGVPYGNFLNDLCNQTNSLGYIYILPDDTVSALVHNFFVLSRRLAKELQ